MKWFLSCYHKNAIFSLSYYNFFIYREEKEGEEPKVPKKRGPKPKIREPVFDENGVIIEQPEKPRRQYRPRAKEVKLDENGVPIETPKRQYNRKKKPEPGSMLDEEKIEVPMLDPNPMAGAEDQLNNEAETSFKNGEMEQFSSETASTSVGSTTAPTSSTPINQSPVKSEDEKKRSPPQPRLKANTPRRPKPNKTLLSFGKKKRKRTNSEGSDVDDALEKTPPPSPPEEDGIEKRRSGRNTKRKKYVDDVPYNLNEEDLKKLPKVSF